MKANLQGINLEINHIQRKEREHKGQDLDINTYT